MPQGNPSGYGPAAPGGRDPSTGGVLRDRFHQLRGNEYGMMGPEHAQRTAVAFLTSRGAPVNAQNLQVAQQYLQGGGLGAFEQQQGTENAIADEAMAADAGSSPVAGGAAPASAAPAPTPAQPPAPVASPVTPQQTNIGPEMMMGPLLAAMFKGRLGMQGATGAVPAIDAIAPPPGVAQIEGPRALNGEIVGGPPMVPPRAGVPVSAADNAVEDAMVVGVNPAQTGNALPAPAPAAAAPQPNPYAAQTDAATAPVATEDIVPQQTESRTVGTGATSSGEYKIERDAEGFKATTPDGKTVRGATAEAVRKALRKAM